MNLTRPIIVGMPKLDDRRCGNCCWFVGAKNKGSGDCRRRSPAVLLSLRTKVTGWPQVHADWFCGDWDVVIR